jgi:hypothetical protein
MDDLKTETQSPDEETRRQFLVTAGKLAIYTPPAIMLLMHPSKDALAQSGGSPEKQWKRVD